MLRTMPVMSVDGLRIQLCENYFGYLCGHYFYFLD